MRVSFAGASTLMPDGWIDESKPDSDSIMFSMPAQAALEVPLALNSKLPNAAANVVVTWENADSLGPVKFLDQKIQELSEAIPGFAPYARGDVGDAQNPIPWAEFELQSKTHISQMLLVRQIADVLYVVTGSSLSSDYQTVKARFVEIAQELSAR